MRTLEFDDEDRLCSPRSNQSFLLKRVQNLPQVTRSDMVTGLLGFTSLEAYIDLQKLSFLGALCRLKPSDIASQLFVHRL